MKESYKIIVLDLDGTLTNSQKELSERNRTTLIALQERGIKLALASGRPTYGIMPLAEALELKRYGGYILAYNGGVIIDCASGKEIYANTLPMELIEPLYRGAKEGGAVLLSYEGEFIITEVEDDKYVAIEAHLNKMATLKVENLMERITKPVPKCLAVGEPEKILALEASLKGAIGERMGIYRSEPFFLELVPNGIDKAFSLGKLSEHSGIKQEEMIAFGDGFNDLTMIEYAGHGVAMANAQAIVKERADALALSNDEDGVAIYLEQIMGVEL
ncbi:MAG: Cof-type HAD-IIB family hydrolase [Rikenellaceae bacterium]